MKLGCNDKQKSSTQVTQVARLAQVARAAQVWDQYLLRCSVAPLRHRVVAFK